MNTQEMNHNDGGGNNKPSENLIEHNIDEQVEATESVKTIMARKFNTAH